MISIITRKFLILLIYCGLVSSITAVTIKVIIQHHHYFVVMTNLDVP